MKSPFVWGQGGRAMTPEDVERERQLVALARAKMGDTSPVGHWTQGATRVVDALGAVLREKRTNKAEAAGLAGADERIAAILSGQGGGFGGGGGYTVSTAGQGAPGVVAPSAAADPAATLGADAMAALGKPPVASAGHDHATHAGQTHADWLKYSNSGAVRDDPLDPALVSAMSFLPDLGVTMDVISGGQDGIGTPGAKRKGSTRHDHGKSADADFYKDGRKLDWNNPEDLPILTQIVQTAKSRGVTGIGAGDDYMGPGRFHVGFGAPAVWGAGGKSANAPAWLVAAYNGAPLGSAPSGGPATYDTAGGAPAIPGGSGGLDIASILALQSDPWVAKKYGGVVDALMGQQFSRQNALWEQQQRMADPMYQAQLAELTAPKVSDYDARAAAAAQYGLQPGTPEYQRFVLAGDVAVPGGADPFAGTKEIGGVLYGSDGQGGFTPLITPPAGAPAAPETQTFFDEATGQEYRAQWNGQEWVRIGGTKAPSGPLVENNIGGADGKFDEAFAKGDAATVETVNNAGLAAQRNLGRIDQLESILSSTPTGMGASLAQAAGEWGIPTEGLSEIQAAQALINSLVPEQRQPGSGPMSDADLALFKQSLPRIINQPGGNQVIIDTMRAIAQYDAEGAAIVQRMRLPPDDPNHLDRGEAFSALQNRPNPLESIKAAGGGGDTPDSSGIPAGIDPADWQFMTPEERALFQ